jgi:propanediol dehydratase small subunit
MPTYPLLENHAEQIYAASGRPLGEITLDALNTLSPEDMQINGETLRQQAEIARRAGYSQLAQNLTRAAELTAVPNNELLRMYELLRPGRASYDEMMQLAITLAEKYGATLTAQFVRQAAEVYQARGLVKHDLHKTLGTPTSLSAADKDVGAPGFRPS